MSRLYGAHHRNYQDQHDSRRLADKIEELAVHTEVSEMDKAFIESRDMFFLATVDHEGRPTVSYKGGDPGFVRVLDATTLAFPLYDGNGMFYSAGNVAGNAKVGLLFIDFTTPNRMRVQGEATIDQNDPLLLEFVEAQLVVRVNVTEVWPNCPRYVHRHEKVSASRYVPRAQCETPLAGWKRIDLVQGDLPMADRGRAEKAGGLLSIEEWFGKVATGAPDA
ncbi:MAG: pyridoxamine 5'-phosphate oxidase family protein [Betaproteobacteria bacterium]|nr:pyridoxamine 5'-phosphate oxidase family protein [Betaproteobacteria bacterium]